jgi:ferrous-iron efflux pump FieF
MDVGSTMRLAPAEESRVKQEAARLSIIVAASLILLKSAVGWWTGSLSVLASLLDSGMDIFASSINLIAVRAAARPADDEHTYGHGKAESLAGLFQAAVIFVSAGYLIVEAVTRFFSPRATGNEWLGAAAMFVALAISTTLVARLRRVARATDSPALHSEASHYLSDIYTNVSALAALLITAVTGWQYADPLISLVISVFILFFAGGVARESVNALMDYRLPPDVDEKVAHIVGTHADEGVLGFHDLRTRSAGAEKFIEFHLEVRRTLSFEQAHHVTVAVLRDLEREIPRARVQIHTDPAD